jgi:hypothetical protein
MSDKITITYEGKEREIFLSYGLLNELARIVRSPDLAPSITIDEDLREEVLAACLAERKASGKITKPVADIEDIDMSIEDVERLLDWATEGVLSFFVRSLGKMVKQVEQNKDTLVALKSSLDGLQASASATA